GVGFVLGLDTAVSSSTATLVISPSSNNSNTVAGTYTGTGSTGGGGSAAPAAPGTPDTGFAYLTANPLLTAGLMTVAAGALVFVARRSRFAHETVQKTAKRK
ncbi:hypothetical protein KDA14_01930, partial [Candidatus Saccharibacteria bacterium]|nr:hypothetical protein [Candidatus Saccharibacteria bacterium]